MHKAPESDLESVGTRGGPATSPARPVRSSGDSPRGRLIAMGAFLTGCLVWSYWDTLDDLILFWERNQDYSVGMLVPFVAAWLVWRRRGALSLRECKPYLPGAGVIVLAEAIRLLGLYYGFGSAPQYALVITTAGVVLLTTGQAVFAKLKWVFLFLFLMVPLPGRVHEAVSLPLQNAATSMTVFGLELLGFFVRREGNVLRIDDHSTVVVAEACSGLRMLTAFVVVAAVLAFLVDRPGWQRVVLVVLSVPIAVFANGLRGCLTACFLNYSNSESMSQGIHDFAGWAMMPVAILLSLGALRLTDVFVAGSAGGSRNRVTWHPVRPKEVG